MNKDTSTIMIPVTLFIIEDSDLGDALRSQEDFASAMLHDDHTLERAGHVFSCHQRWSYGANGIRVDSMASYAQSFSDAMSPTNDIICIVDCDLGNSIGDHFKNPFNDTTHLPERLLRNPASHPGLAFAKRLLDGTSAGDRFVFVAFSNVTIHDNLWASLKNHAAWQVHSRRFDCIPSLPGCERVADLRGAVSKAIDLFLNAKGFGPSAEARIREGTADWFPPQIQ